MPTTQKTPGVYINEVNAFPNSIVAVETAIPAFIGYTARASYNGKSYTNIPVKIDSLQQFMTFFGALDASDKPLPENLQYTPVYYPKFVKEVKKASDVDFRIGDKAYQLEPDKCSVYYLYNSIKLFFNNSGGTCYVVSVGPYGAREGKPKDRAEALVNPNIKVDALLKGLALLEQETEPTMVVVPDAALLNDQDNQKLNGKVLEHCSTQKTRVALVDILGGENPDLELWMKSIEKFRTAIGTTGLNYAASYYPFLKTSVLSDSDIDFTHLDGGKTLASNLPDLDPLAKTLLGNIDKDNRGKDGSSSDQVENALRNASKVYKQLHDVVLARMNILPPSAAMAGIYTRVDTEKGVWHAPANVSLASVTDTTLKITSKAQADLNVHVSGKSINAIRLFPGKGVLVWGARTLDGNSDDWRYINVRRTLIMLEESMKNGAFDYVFAPNDANTWSLVKSMLNNFLTNQWRQGALVGATPGEAFSVQVGLGITMTAQDILDGYMNISVKVAVSHPAEFIVITIQQQMQTS
jgi:phage tail sheath protein FI